MPVCVVCPCRCESEPPEPHLYKKKWLKSIHARHFGPGKKHALWCTNCRSIDMEHLRSPNPSPNPNPKSQNVNVEILKLDGKSEIARLPPICRMSRNHWVLRSGRGLVPGWRAGEFKFWAISLDSWICTLRFPFFRGSPGKMNSASREGESSLDCTVINACLWTTAVVEGLSCPSCPGGCGFVDMDQPVLQKGKANKPWGWKSPPGPRRRAPRIAAWNRPAGSGAPWGKYAPSIQEPRTHVVAPHTVGCPPPC